MTSLYKVTLTVHYRYLILVFDFSVGLRSYNHDATSTFTTFAEASGNTCINNRHC